MTTDAHGAQPPTETDAPRPGAGRSLLGAMRLAAADIKLAHSVFALPFAVLAGVMAGRDLGAGQMALRLALIALCMVSARTWAMLINRIADRAIDAANPRTTKRAVASGALGLRDARLLAAGSAVVFVLCCALFWVLAGNFWPLALSLPVLGWLALYSYTKRFTALCHLVLGSALALSPISAAIAIDPSSLGAQPALWWLSGMVLLWVAGFDVIYALQDEDFDRARGLRSIPGALGAARAIWVSRALHAGAFACIALAWRSDGDFGVIFGIAVLATGGLLIAEHAVLAKRGRAGLQMAFFTLNGVLSVLTGALGVADVWW